MEGNKFDPMTGEPIVRETVQETVNSVNDAAATAANDFAGAATTAANDFAGAATTAANDFAGAAQTTAAQAEQAVYDTTPVEPQKKGGKGKLIAIIAGAVVLVAAIACLVIFVLLPMFGKPTKKIYTAMQNTFSNLNKGENQLMSELLPAGMENADTFTLSVDGSIYDEYSDAEYTGDISFIKTADALQIAGGVDLGDLMDLPYIDVQFLMDKKTIQLASSLLQYRYVYNYTKEPDGFIADILEESGMEADDLNNILKDLYKTMMDTEGMKKISDDLYADWEKAFHDLEVKKIDAEEFNINGKDVKCQGYKVKVTSKDMKKFMDSYKKSMKGIYEGSFSSILAMADMDVDDLMDEMFGEFDDTIEDMEDFEIDFYIYQNALAA
ncbi:MAG: hypothetical protein K5888_10820, partial [Lachnospiraceae bacterium]|nr:hypothetical protein [Lachnospiraceae bacterium]